ncbi:unnamed protein product, partial [Arabidopsis halleri]
FPSFGARPQFNSRPFRPYLGKCQACGVQGHSAQRCTQFRIVATNSSPFQASSPVWQPRAHVASMSPALDTPAWLLDSGASHHIASDLSNLALHSPYQGNETITLGDGSGHPITHTGEGSSNGGASQNRKH